MMGTPAPSIPAETESASTLPYTQISWNTIEGCMETRMRSALWNFSLPPTTGFQMWCHSVSGSPLLPSSCWSLLTSGLQGAREGDLGGRFGVKRVSFLWLIWIGNQENGNT